MNTLPRSAVGRQAVSNTVPFGTRLPRHLRILAVGLGLALRDRAEFAGVGHDHGVAERGHQARDPRAVRAGLHHKRRARITGAERGQHLAGVGQRFLNEDVMTCVG